MHGGCATSSSRPTRGDDPAADQRTRPAPILERLDGVLLTGGDDLDPKKMGLSPHPSVTVMPERRETSDRLLCKLIQQRKMPVLGVGLGMQGAQRRQWRQHLPPPSRGYAQRAFPTATRKGRARHTVIMEPGTRLEEIYGPGEITGQQLHHHQGIRKLAPIFRTVRLAPRRPDPEGYEGQGAEPVGHRRSGGTPRTRVISPSTCN